MSELKIGFSPLNDAALILVAQASGFYEAEGLDVTLSREANWSNIRDKLAYGLIDAAHLLAPMPLASALNAGPRTGRIIAPMAMGANGNSMVVSSHLKAALETEAGGKRTLMGTARALASEVNRRRRMGEGQIVLAYPFIYSPHHFVLRHWVSSAGLDPERQIQWVALPPSRMARMLKDGVIDGFCSGSPWPQTAVLNGEGEILFSDPDYWSLKPEKILGVRERWAEENPAALQALTRALLNAAQWAADPSHRADLIRVLVRTEYVNAPKEAIEMALSDGGAGLVLDPEVATFPWISHAKWFLGQLVRWGMAGPDNDFDAIARRIYRPDLWREAAGSLNFNCPLHDEKIEGAHAVPWQLPAVPNAIDMPPNRLFDGGIFLSGPQK